MACNLYGTMPTPPSLVVSVLLGWECHAFIAQIIPYACTCAQVPCHYPYLAQELGGGVGCQNRSSYLPIPRCRWRNGAGGGGAGGCPRPATTCDANSAQNLYLGGGRRTPTPSLPALCGGHTGTVPACLPIWRAWEEGGRGPGILLLGGTGGLLEITRRWWAFLGGVYTPALTPFPCLPACCPCLTLWRHHGSFGWGGGGHFPPGRNRKAWVPATPAARWRRLLGGGWVQTWADMVPKFGDRNNLPDLNLPRFPEPGW